MQNNEATRRPGIYDPRLKIILAGAAGFLAWRSGPAGLLLYLAMLAGLAVVLRGGRVPLKAALVRGAIFAGFWAAAKFLFAVWEGAGTDAAVTEAGLLGLRLLVLMGVGFALASSASPREMALGVASMLRPLMGKRAWRPALSLALMIHFLPVALALHERTSVAMAARRVERSRWVRFQLRLSSWLGGLSQEASSQAIAVAARGLDREEAWRVPMPVHAGEWLSGLVLLILLYAAGRI